MFCNLVNYTLLNSKPSILDYEQTEENDGTKTYATFKEKRDSEGTLSVASTPETLEMK